MKSVIVSWSGGKDSCFAAYKAQQSGYTLKYLLNTVSDDYQRVRFHGVEARIIQLQAEALGIPLIQGPTRPAAYETDYKSLLKSVPDVRGIVFGDIFLEDCYSWAKTLAQEYNLQLIEPLWNKPSHLLLQEFTSTGFQALVVSVQGDLLDPSWIGRPIDKSFIKGIRCLSQVDPCGENGEYHTLVLNGPLFKKKIMITKSQKVRRGGYWFLDIQEYLLVK